MKRRGATDLIVAALIVAAGCSRDEPMPAGTLVFTQVPRVAQPAGSTDTDTAADVLVLRYPPGSRVVLSTEPHTARVLSTGLLAAGAPCVAPDGQSVVFVGLASAAVAWQLFEVRLPDGEPKRLTDLKGGAADPSHLADGHLVFTSPVARAQRTFRARPWPALHSLEPWTKTVRRLSFGSGAVSDPTVLRDGRILFVGVQPNADTDAAAPVRLALFVVNSDGTCLLPFGAHHEGLASVRRPRETADGRVVFLGSETVAGPPRGRAEQLLLSRPFRSRAQLTAVPARLCRSLEPTADGSLLAALQTATRDGQPGSYAIYSVGDADSTDSGSAPRTPLFDDPDWDDIEAVSVSPRRAPRRLPSVVKADQDTGMLLCLDVNETTVSGPFEKARAPAASARVLGLSSDGSPVVLGEVPVHEDGSMLAEVPADAALGFEVLDASGRVLRRLPPSLWLRPGETRACCGCHAEHGRTSRNRRPLALREAPTRITAHAVDDSNGEGHR